MTLYASATGASMNCRNLKVNGRRTSLRLEQEIWDALEDVARRRCLSVSDLVSEVDGRRGDGALASELRVYLLGYYRTVVQRLDIYGMTRAMRPSPSETVTLQ